MHYARRCQVSLVVLLGVWGFINLSIAQEAPSMPRTTSAKLLHLLNRLGYGPTPGGLVEVARLGQQAYLQQQLNPSRIQENPQLEQRLTELPPVHPLPGIPTTRPEMDALRRQVYFRVTHERLWRAIYSRRQLQETMVDFWYNHFNVDSGRSQTLLWIAGYESDAIRPHVLGNFRSLLGATARHPAMLVYLDNQLNTSPNSPGQGGIYRGLNENYARELLELHTLGVNGGYTQTDVTTLARILTGWGICLPPKPAKENFFCFSPNRHDFSDKVFLGQRIAGKGEAEVEQALDMLARHPSTARHISFKLAQYFVSDQPPPLLVDRLAQRFRETNGDIEI